MTKNHSEIVADVLSVLVQERLKLGENLAYEFVERLELSAHEKELIQKSYVAGFEKALFLCFLNELPSERIGKE